MDLVKSEEVMSSAEREIEILVKSFFDSFDNRGGRRPNFDQFKALFADGATIGKRNLEEVAIWPLRKFWDPRANLLTGGSLTEFHEWETHSRTSIMSGIATRYCDYEKEGLLNGALYKGKGTKLIQFASTPDGWRITSVLWEDQE